MPKAKEKYDARTKKVFEEMGWTYEKTEHYNPFGGFSSDFGGFADAVVYDSRGGGRTIALQITTSANWSARRRKITSNQRAHTWLQAGNELWGIVWKKSYVVKRNKAGRPQRQKEYSFEVKILQLSDFLS